MLTELEKKLIASIQEDIAVNDRPYLHIAKELGISEETLLEKLQSLCSRGFIRRFGATLRHQKTGFTANAMAAWQVAEDRIDEVGKKWHHSGRSPIVTGVIPPKAGRIIFTP